MNPPEASWSMPYRVLVTLLVAVLAASSCTVADRRPVAFRGFMDMARTLGSDVLLHILRGHVPGRSGEIALVAEPWNVVGRWNGGVRGPDDPRTTHASPWSYHQRVPVILYGPGHVRQRVRSERPVDLADLAPTFGELMGFPFGAPDGSVLREALEPGRSEPPRAVILVAYDGGGWNVLEQWPDAWPTQRRLALEGTVYTNATAGSAPSITAPVHSTMGTGAYPRIHGIPENTARLPDGSIGEIYFHKADPRMMRAETLADAWDRAVGNRAWVGMLGQESWHLGMMSRGARAPGGDRDVAVLWERDRLEFWINERWYSLPDYLPGRDVLEGHARELDGADGALDGSWGKVLLDVEEYYFPGTPAFVDYQSDAVMEMVEREPIGQDSVTDLLFVELKATDIAGHVWNMLGSQQEEILAAQDRLLSRLVTALDRKIGRGGYVLAVTADHGQTPIPTTRGGFRVDHRELETDIEEQFGADVVQAIHPSELYLDLPALAEGGHSVDEVARYVADYRVGESLAVDADPAEFADSALGRRVFAAALPGSFLDSLTHSDVAALGAGAYPEGDLRTPPALASL
jgi:Type I phosphodiesterase / nucleotide pyrophosphatase